MFANGVFEKSMLIFKSLPEKRIDYNFKLGPLSIFLVMLVFCQTLEKSCLFRKPSDPQIKEQRNEQVS